MRTAWICSIFFALFLIFPSIPVQSKIMSTADLSTTWTNDDDYLYIETTDFSLRLVLGDGFGDSSFFSCGFICNGNCTSYLFAILLVHSLDRGYTSAVIWSANRNNPVREGATLNLTAAGELVLQDVNGSIVWTTNTAGKSVAGMKLTDNGNLVLFDGHNSTVWQSFDHPTDSLLPGQKLFQGQKLIPSVSSTNWTAQKDLYYLQVTHQGLFAYVGSNPPQLYDSYLVDVRYTKNAGRTYVGLFNLTGELSFNLYNEQPGEVYTSIVDSPKFPTEYIKLMPDGHLKAFGWDSSRSVSLDADILSIEGCYPFSCGGNAICLSNQQCICPVSSSLGTETDYFKRVDEQQPNKGCFPITTLTCNSTQDQHFIQLKNVRYFSYEADMKGVNATTCKQACQKNCSCKAALFRYSGSSSSDGYCDLPSELLTMSNFDGDLLDDDNELVHLSAFIKVQNRSTSPSSNMSQKRKKRITTVVAPIVGSLVFLVIVVVGFALIIVQKQQRDNEIEEEHLDHVTGLPTRFPYEELKAATENFSKKLGQGGFGSVFLGTLEDGSQIAVKCLQGLAHVKKSFLTEVESIGSIHHVNLVHLRGFCAWKSERLLVYEFMSNGSLDEWIYNGDRKQVLGWICRKKIILDIAKGLAYLHEDCRQKIIHLDIKPQNILLDEDFNAKVADFGLSKLIDRDESQVMTTMRGTPGYLAPEWLSSFITEKVDVYSFGILLLEILCGRKIFDRSQPDDNWHLLCVFQRCWEQGTLLSIVDRSSEDMQVNGTQVMEMMKVASWCLQTDFTKRPSMSTVIKVLEGVMSVESNLDYNFSYPRLQESTDAHEKSSKPVLHSVLSGPR